MLGVIIIDEKQEAPQPVCEARVFRLLSLMEPAALSRLWATSMHLDARVLLCLHSGPDDRVVLGAPDSAATQMAFVQNVDSQRDWRRADESIRPCVEYASTQGAVARQCRDRVMYEMPQCRIKGPGLERARTPRRSECDCDLHLVALRRSLRSRLMRGGVQVCVTCTSTYAHMQMCTRSTSTSGTYAHTDVHHCHEHVNTRNRSVTLDTAHHIRALHTLSGLGSGSGEEG